MKKKGLFLIFFICLFTIVFAEEQVTIATYYPSPYGSYRELTASERVAIGDVNGDNKVDVGDLMIDINDGVSPVRGSLTVANRLAIGTKAPWASFEMYSSAFNNGVDNTFRIIAKDPLPGQGGAAGPARTNRSPAVGFARSDGGPIGSIGMAGFYNAWTGGSSPGDFVLTTGNIIGGNFLIGTANTNDFSRARLIIAPNGRIGIGGYYGATAPPMPPPEALLDVRGEGEAILVPRSANAPADAKDGMLYYSTTLKKFQVREDGSWRDVGGGGPSSLSGNSRTMVLPAGTTYTVLCWATYHCCEDVPTTLYLDKVPVKTYNASVDVDGGNPQGCDQNTIMVKWPGVTAGTHGWSLVHSGWPFDQDDYLWIAYPEN